MEGLLRDVRHAVCNLLRTPGFAFVTILGLALGIACANLANRLLARAESRHREFAVRAALGANRGRRLRQFVVEDCLLSFTGAALGLGVAVLGVRSLIAAYPAASRDRTTSHWIFACSPSRWSSAC